LLEIDLHIKEKGDCFELGPSSVLDSCTKIRLCQSLSQLEDPQTLPEKHTFQTKAQKILDHFTRYRHNDPINPFDSSTYKSLLKKIGRAIDLAGQFLKPIPWASLIRDDQKYLLCNEACSSELKIYDTWILFERKRPEASRIVALDAKRFLDKLRDPSVQIPPLWKHITTEERPSPCSHEQPSESSDFLLSMQQNNQQLKILKCLESNDCVIVRGPPGTGKSHTIGKWKQYSAHANFFEVRQIERKKEKERKS